MSSNLSQPYGFYGGVTQQNHYVPPPALDFQPQPKSVPFTKQYREILQSMFVEMPSAGVTVAEFLTSNEAFIMFRRIVGQTDGLNDFEINTQERPNDLLIYSALSAVAIDLLKLDGGII